VGVGLWWFWVEFGWGVQLGCGLGGVGKGLFAIPFNLVVRGGCCLVGVKCWFACITAVTRCVGLEKDKIQKGKKKEKKKNTPNIHHQQHQPSSNKKFQVT
jgi:hypothetical protein